MMETTVQPKVALAISGVTATASAASWAADHAAWFTILAAIAAILSGFAAFVFYCVSIYYKIKVEHVGSTPQETVKTVTVVTKASQ